MAERFLVSRRQAPATGGFPGLEAMGMAEPAPGRGVRAELEALSPAMSVQRLEPNSAIVQVEGAAEEAGDARQALEAAGYRVKRLPETELIYVGNYAVDVERETVVPIEEGSAEAAAEMLTIPDELRAIWPHHLVQLVAPPTAEWIAEIEKAGVDVVEPISRYGLFVAGTPSQVAGLRGIRLKSDPASTESFVVWTGPFEPAYRLAPDLLEKLNTFGEFERLRIGIYPAEAAPAVEEQIALWQGRVVEHWEEERSYHDRFAFLIAELGSQWLGPLACLPTIRLIEPQSDLMSTEDERSAQIIVPDLNTEAPPATAPRPNGYAASLQRLGVDGSGVIIGICDTGVDTNSASTLHRDLRGRLSFFHDVTNGQTPQDRKGHGTHVAGIALGNGASGATEPGPWTLGQGIAPRAQFGVVNPVDTAGSPGLKPLGDYTKHMVAGAASIMNNSWNDGGSSGYTAAAALVDRLVRDPNSDNGADPSRNHLILVFSAGNNGPNSRTITSPKEAKNPIVVGNSLHVRGAATDIRGINASSSRGPTRDGRIVPTLVAPGTEIVSARSSANPGLSSFKDQTGTVHSGHTVMTGTSMATPHVSGACALIVQCWRARTGQLPSAALVKALLINGAHDLAGGPNGKPTGSGKLDSIPNNDQGWGRLSLSNILLDFPLSDRGPRLIFDQDSTRAFTTQGTERLFRVRAARPGAPLRITLVWTDPPGAANALPALVNDLDLEVTESDGPTVQVYKGNVFDQGFSVPDAGDFDAINPVECVYVRQTSINAVYEIRVIAQTLTQNALPPFSGSPFQDFALVVDNAIEIP